MARNTSSATATPRITLDPIPASVSRSDDLAVTFSPPDFDETNWRINSPCASGSGGVADGAPSVLIAAGSIRVPGGGTCAAELELTRTRYAVPPYELRGELLFTTVASAPFESTP